MGYVGTYTRIHSFIGLRSLGFMGLRRLTMKGAWGFEVFRGLGCLGVSALLAASLWIGLGSWVEGRVYRFGLREPKIKDGPL